jgi:hypothetical protein
MRGTFSPLAQAAIHQAIKQLSDCGVLESLTHEEKFEDASGERGSLFKAQLSGPHPQIPLRLLGPLRMGPFNPHDFVNPGFDTVPSIIPLGGWPKRTVGRRPR